MGNPDVPTAELRPCCIAYIAHGDELIAEWEAVIDDRSDPTIRAKDYRWAIRELRVNHAEVRAGRWRYGGCCPWGSKPEWGIDGWKNYLAVMDAAKNDPDFEAHLGPIKTIYEVERGL